LQEGVPETACGSSDSAIEAVTEINGKQSSVGNPIATRQGQVKDTSEADGKDRQKKREQKKASHSFVFGKKQCWVRNGAEVERQKKIFPGLEAGVAPSDKILAQKARWPRDARL
jgi:hypothetical protein